MTRVTLASTATDAGNHPLALPKSAPGGVLFLPALVSAALSHHNVVELAKATSLQLLRLPTPLTVDASPPPRGLDSHGIHTVTSIYVAEFCRRPPKITTSSITVFFAIRRVRNNHQPDIAEFCCVSPKAETSLQLPAQLITQAAFLRSLLARTRRVNEQSRAST